MKPILALVDVDIRANQDETAREQVLAKLTGYRGDAVTPLWLNWLRMRADLRFACLVNDLTRLDDFLTENMRCVPGVRGTQAYLAFDGVVYGDVIESLHLQNSPFTRRAAATVTIRVEPGKDREVAEALETLPSHNQVEVGYVMKMFHSHACDMMVLLLGERTSALSGYVMSWIRTVSGVADTQVVSTLDWQVLGSTEDLIALAHCFPEPSRRR